MSNLYSDEPTGRLALVFELMDMNMYEAIKGNSSEFNIWREEALPSWEQG